ncbi:GroES-like protein [Thozetella sp. PMI_491]|nr:GroES-like protein [Thozetella sp. PMI_491]
MRSVMWEGNPLQVAIATDAIIQVTTASVCGTDFHIYHGVFGGTDVPYPLGHEVIGIVAEVGSAVQKFKVGDHVLIPTDPNPDELLVGPEPGPVSYSNYGLGNVLGNLGGTQAEFVRVPIADQSLVKLPINADPKQFLFNTDIFPTAWAGLDLAGFNPGDTVAIYGAGPVGLLAAYSALLRGANKVYVVDRVEDRLFLAASIGAIPIDMTKEDPAAQILRKEPNGVQRVVDCVGMEAVNTAGQQDEGFILSQAVNITSFHGGLGIVGIYNAEGRTAGTPLGASIPASISFPMTPFWAKGITIGAGIVDALRYQQQLFELVSTGRAQPGFIVSNMLNIEDAPEAYSRFDQKLETKVLLEMKS